MALSGTQKGVVGQYEFLQVAMVTGAGDLLAYVPAADDEQRDAELHRRGASALAVGVQIKISSALERLKHHVHPYVRIQFSVASNRIVSGPGFWYFFAAFDFKQLGFVDPVFLVPSELVHAHCRVHSTKPRMAVFCFTASMNPKARDLFARHRFTTSELGPRVLKILGDLPKRKTLTLPEVLESGGIVLVARRRRSQKARPCLAA